MDAEEPVTTDKRREFRLGEIKAAAQRLRDIVCDETRIEPESADAYYLVLAISALERWHRALVAPLETGVTYCAYCSARFVTEVPDGTALFEAHIRECDKHPVQRWLAEARRETLLDVCRAHGGNPEDPYWSTPEGIAAVIEELRAIGSAAAAEASALKCGLTVTEMPAEGGR